MSRLLTALLVLVGLTACQTTNTTASGTVTPSGTSGNVNVSDGPVNVGVNSSGTVGASVDVVQTPDATVRVGTSGPSANVRVGNSPLRVGLSPRGLGLRL